MARNETGISKQIVLAEAVTNAVGGRRIKVAVFTTFEFEPSFFELHVLPCLFADVAWSNMPNVKRAQVRDTLIGLQHMAVFYDRRGLKPEGGSARLDYDRIAVAPPRGVFHAKNMMFLVENRSEDEASDDATEDSVVLITTSANLTRHGWHENLEVAQVLEIKSGEASAVRDDMLNQGGLLSFLEHLSLDGAPQPSVQAIRQFLLKHTYRPSHLKHRGRLRPRLYVGRERFENFLGDAGRIGPHEYCLEIVSPFFEDTSDARTLIALLEAVNPIETRIYLPRDDDGTARCSEDYFQAVQQLAKERNVHWACLPSELTRWSRKGDKTKHRNVHAKVYRLFRRGRAKEDWRDVQAVGSVNLTRAAHAGSTKGNFETAILVDLECERRPDWWMTPLETLPARFAPQASDEDAGTLACHELTLRFDWEKVRLDYFWKAESRRPQRASMLANGCSLFEFEKIVFDAWRALDEPARQSIQDRLKTSSLVELLVEGELPQPLLVQEVNMDQKPPLLEQLTAAEILEYWSLLTQDQRNDFLERKLAAILEPDERQKGVKPPEPAESFFDRFAGIFHAFSCLEEHVLDALKRKSVKDARYRLLGKSYDSLPTLARQVKESADKDPVVAYVTLLRASEVFRNLRRQIHAAGIKSDFLEANKSACSEYERKWAADCEEVKSRITLEGSHDPATFFAWYEKQFAKPVQVAAD